MPSSGRSDGSVVYPDNLEIVLGVLSDHLGVLRCPPNCFPKMYSSILLAVSKCMIEQNNSKRVHGYFNVAQIARWICHDHDRSNLARSKRSQVSHVSVAAWLSNRTSAHNNAIVQPFKDSHRIDIGPNNNNNNKNEPNNFFNIKNISRYRTRIIPTHAFYNCISFFSLSVSACIALLYLFMPSVRCFSAETTSCFFTNKPFRFRTSFSNSDAGFGASPKSPK